MTLATPHKIWRVATWEHKKKWREKTRAGMIRELYGSHVMNVIYSLPVH